MNILIITQSVNSKDPILGFFHDWIAELANHYAHITVICLYKGAYSLPTNVEVLSLGKEEKAHKFVYLWRFYKYITLRRKSYKSVFVHMNEEYVLLAGLIWRVLRKRVILWRNHKSGTWKTRLAGQLSNRVLYTSRDSYTASFKNALAMPVGINDEIFRPIKGTERKSGAFIYVGRISPIKNIDSMISGFATMHKENPEINFSFSIVGPADSEKDRGYMNMLVDKVKREGLEHRISFEGPVTQQELPALYSRHTFSINLTSTGSLDKTLWESVMCGCIPVAYNKSFLDQLPESIRSEVGVSSLRSIDVASALKRVVNGKTEERRGDLVSLAARQSLKTLTKQLIEIL